MVRPDAAGEDASVSHVVTDATRPEGVVIIVHSAQSVFVIAVVLALVL